jgi:hypothetical protein
MGGVLSSKVEDDWKSDARYAMEAGPFCVVCGGPFDIEGDVYNIDPKDIRFQVRYLLKESFRNTNSIKHTVVVQSPSPWSHRRRS